MSLSGIEWWRGRDNHGRVHTFARTATEFTHYYPDDPDDAIGFSHRSQVNPSRYARVEDFNKPVSSVQMTRAANLFDGVCESYGIVETAPSARQPGEYFPRMWREGECPHPRHDASLRGPWMSAIRYSRILYAKLRELTAHVEPERRHDFVFGHEIRQLLILSCTEVENAWRSVLVKNWAQCPDPEKLTTRDYVRLSVPMRLGEWQVALSAHPAYGELAPFETWDANKPTQSLPWYGAYNATKHNREINIIDAQLGHALNALAAVFIMTIAQFGPDHLDETEFHPDEFRVTKWPSLPLNEQYIRPLAPPGSSAVAGSWQEVACPGI